MICLFIHLDKYMKKQNIERMYFLCEMCQRFSLSNLLQGNVINLTFHLFQTLSSFFFFFFFFFDLKKN